MEPQKSSKRAVQFKLLHRSSLIWPDLTIAENQKKGVVTKCRKTFNRLTAMETGITVKQAILRISRSPQVVFAIVIWLCTVGFIAIGARASSHDYMVLTLSLFLTCSVMPWNRIQMKVNAHAQKNKIPYGLYIVGVAGFFCAVILVWLPLRAVVPDDVSKFLLAHVAVAALLLRIAYDRFKARERMDTKRLNFRLPRPNRGNGTINDSQ